MSFVGGRGGLPPPKLILHRSDLHEKSDTQRRGPVRRQHGAWVQLYRRVNAETELG